jgi:hypothetical protein
MLLPIAACISQAGWIHFQSSTHVSKNLVIFNAASRGPMGSLQLLPKFWRRLFACLGALITVLSFRINPMMQLLITVQTRAVDSTTGFGTHFGNDLWVPEPDLIGIMFEGILRMRESCGASTSQMNVSCMTGNFTYPPFQSPAVESACEDLTDKQSRTCSNASGEFEAPCEYTLPNGLNIIQTTQSLTASGCLAPVNRVRYGNSFNFSMTTDAINPLRLLSTTAVQCRLYWCVNTYESSILNGQLQEHVRSLSYSNTTDLISLDPTSANSMRLELLPPRLTNDSPQPTFTLAYRRSQSTAA